MVIVRVHDAASLRDVVLERRHRIKAVRSAQTVLVLDEDRRLPRLRSSGRAPHAAERSALSAVREARWPSARPWFLAEPASPGQQQRDKLRI
jgi:hypothetical protein